MMKPSGTWRLRSFAAICALVGAFAYGPATAQDAPPLVRLLAVTFAPTELHVAPGTTVVWTNPSGITHTVTADDGSFDSGNVSAGAVFTTQFDAPGSYQYYCQIHGGPGGQDMAGVIVVDDPNA